MIHARRPYADFIKSLGKKTPAKENIILKPYDMITEILHLDSGFDYLSVTDCKKRQAKLKEKVDAYFAYIKEKYEQLTHNSTIGKVLKYSINQEK